MRVLENSEMSQVTGGSDFICAYPEPEYFRDTFLIDELFKYQTGQPSLFGPNPDLQGDLPPLPPG
jgi:hypothetical protein